MTLRQGFDGYKAETDDCRSWLDLPTMRMQKYNTLRRPFALLGRMVDLEFLRASLCVG
eukprot:COSAG02_NODE_1910_length_10418_cov_44.653552_7_plen_58_part_00